MCIRLLQSHLSISDKKYNYPLEQFKTAGTYSNKQSDGRKKHKSIEPQYNGSLSFDIAGWLPNSIVRVLLLRREFTTEHRHIQLQHILPWR